MTVCHVWKPSEKRSAVGLSGKLSALDPRWLRPANWWYGRNAFGVFGQLLGDALGKGKIEFARQKCIAGEELLARKRQTRHVEISTGRDSACWVHGRCFGSGNAAQPIGDRRPGVSCRLQQETRERDCERTRLGDPRWTITEYSGQLGPGFILRRKEAIWVAVNGGKWLGAAVLQGSRSHQTAGNSAPTPLYCTLQTGQHRRRPLKEGKLVVSQETRKGGEHASNQTKEETTASFFFLLVAAFQQSFE